MSITSALNGALSGLQAFGRASQAISSNIANATTPGYGPRSVNLASNATAPGVSVLSIERQVDPVILAARRDAEAQAANAGVLAGFQSRVLNAVGTPDEAYSLNALVARFEASLVEAASSPDAPARLDRVANAATDLVGAVNDAAQTISDARSAADRRIGQNVERLNTALQNVADLNVQITTARSRGVDVSALVDQRLLLIDQINALVPIREVSRPNGQVALFSLGGEILLDGPAAEIGFVATNTVTPYQSVAAGTLSELTINGRVLDTSAETSPLRGGSLLAQFAVRDDAAPAAQARLDAFARDLISRFQSPNADNTLAVGDPGLFTDQGVAFAPADEVGIANRLSLNALVDPAAGGDLWRLRSGLGAAGPGAVGDSSVLISMRAALTNAAPIASGNFGPGALTSTGLAAQLTSWAGSQSAGADQRQSFLSASLNEAVQAELASGVDTDAELQSLLLVERTYAANARVLETVDNMLEELLRVA